jgi:hypothetical protein
MRQLESRDDWPKTMEDFGRIANIETKQEMIKIF